MIVRLAVCLALATLMLCHIPGCCAGRSISSSIASAVNIAVAGGRNADRPLVGALTGGGNRPKPPIRVGPRRRCLKHDRRGRCVYWSRTG